MPPARRSVVIALLSFSVGVALGYGVASEPAPAQVGATEHAQPYELEASGAEAAAPSDPQGQLVWLDELQWKSPYDPRVVAAVVDLADSRDSEVREHAARVLAQLARYDDAASAALRRLIDDEDDAVATAALGNLLRQQRHDVWASQRAIEWLSAPSEEKRVAALLMLPDVRALGRAEWRRVSDIAAGGTERERAHALGVCADMGRDAPEIVEAMVLAVEASSEHLQFAGLMSARMLGVRDARILAAAESLNASSDDDAVIREARKVLTGWTD